MCRARPLPVRPDPAKSMARSMIPCPRGDAGSMIPMIMMAFAVAGLIVAGTIAAGSAFLAQRDLQSVCDGAALAAAQVLDDDPYYAADRGPLSRLPLGDVQRAVNTYALRDAADSDDSVRMIAAVRSDGVTVRVQCRTHIDIPFQSVFRRGGLDRRATADARSPTALNDRNGPL
jgi:hypothetical protein